MTLIALATYGDHAEFISDDTSYTVTGSSFGRCTKHLLLTHLDAAVLTQGDGEFGSDAKAGSLQMSARADDFDAFADGAGRWLHQLWTDAATDAERTDSTVLIVGYSTRSTEFVAYRYASESDFAQVPVYGLWATPMPWNLRPTTLEVERMKRNPHITDRGKRDTAAMWLARPTPPVPQDISQWIQFAETVREHRALEAFSKVFVAGNVNHTSIRKGAAITQRIHTYDDTGDEFNRLVANTHHPQAQLGPCHCGSGDRFIDCHLVQHLDDPCGCGSGAVMRDCCAVTA